MQELETDIKELKIQKNQVKIKQKELYNNIFQNPNFITL